MYAVHLGHTSIVRMLLNKGASTSEVADSGFTALLVAAGCGRMGTTTVSSAVFEGTTPLHLAAGGGYLVEAGDNFNSCASGGWTPIFVAATKGKIDSINMLFRASETRR